MLSALKGYHEHGRIMLTERPPVETKTEIVVTFLSEKKSTKVKSKRKLGTLEGKIKTSDDFNEPLEDLKDYM